MTDVAMVTPILMAGLKSASYKTESDCIFTGATLEMGILSQCGECNLRECEPSFMNHGKRSVVGQLTPVEFCLLTVSETTKIDEPAGGYMEMMEYETLTRGHLIALENKGALECYPEEIIKDTTMKRKAYGTVASSEIHTETLDQLVRQPWRAVLLRHFEKYMRYNPRVHAQIAITYVRTELQLRLACMAD